MTPLGAIEKAAFGRPFLFRCAAMEGARAQSLALKSRHRRKPRCSVVADRVWELPQSATHCRLFPPGAERAADGAGAKMSRARSRLAGQMRPTNV